MSTNTLGGPVPSGVRTNADRLVEIGVLGHVVQPQADESPRVDKDGRPFFLPSTGGITRNVLVGDSAVGWCGDHIEPGVSLVYASDRAPRRTRTSLMFLACCGNRAVVMSGDAKGSVGTVTGMHGGINHVLVDFPVDVMNRMCIDDKVQVWSMGQGLRLLDLPDVHVMNLDPGLLSLMRMRIDRGQLCVPVRAVFTSAAMGSGIGSSTSYDGDCDIVTSQPVSADQGTAQNLCLGDLVAIPDHDARWGRTNRPGITTIGVVVHADSIIAGHGPGVTALMSAPSERFVPEVSESANIARYLKIGRYRPSLQEPE